MKTVNSFFKRKYALLTLQFIALVVFVLLIVGAIGVTTNDPVFAKTLRNTNLANLIVWSYWWPIIIVTAILFGRFWCSVCPMELVTSFFGKIGLRKKPGGLLQSGWVITLFYALILIVGIHTFSIHRIPQLMAVYMLILLAVAIAVGLIWEKRTFCTYVCPIGHLLGLYALLSRRKLRVKNPAVCESCSTKDCISKKSHYKLVGRSCTSELYPPMIKDNRKCILCGQCFKSCSKDNIAIQRQPFSASGLGSIKLSSAEIFFFFMVSGFVIYEVLSEWSVTKAMLLYLPNRINELFMVTGPFKGTVKAAVLFLLLPSLFYSLFALLSRFFSKADSWKKLFSGLALAILPITASMHLLKALLKTTSRVPYWSYVFSDAKGVDTASRIVKNPHLLNNAFYSQILKPVDSVFAVLLIVLGLILSIAVIRKQQPDRGSRTVSLVAALCYFTLFAVTILYWRVL